MNSLEKAQLSDMFSISHSSPNFLYIRKINPNIVAFIIIYKEWVMNLNKMCLITTLLASFALAGCQANADNYAADVYEPGQLNSKQETKTVDIISVLPAKVAVDNRENKQAAQTIGVILGALAGGVAGHNVGSGSGLATTAGAVGGGALGAAAGSLVKDKTLVEGISLTYREGTKVYTSTQVGKECQFTTGLAVVISTRNDETRIQPNTKCPDKK
jgi:outer membrane lipoprotein SlyB